MKLANIYCIGKKENDFNNLIKEYAMKIRTFGAEIKNFDIFDNAIMNAQKSDNLAIIQKSYTSALSPYVSKNCANIALSPSGEELDSFSFAKLLEHKNEINFFIGGAFGLESSFLAQMQTISLSRLTLAHKIAKIVLCEQIYRALSILSSHPYHK